MSDTNRPGPPEPETASRPAPPPGVVPRTAEAIERLVKPLLPGARRFLLRLSSNDDKQDVQDHLHNVFVKLLVKLRKLPPGTDLPLVVKRLCREEMRQHRRDAKDEIVLLVDVPEDRQREVAPDPEAFLRAVDMQRLAAETLAAMGEGMRKVFLLNVLDDVPAGEIAEMLGLPPKTVSSRIDRANAILSKALEAPLVKRRGASSPRLPAAVILAVKALEAEPAGPEEEKEEARLTGLLVAGLFKLVRRHRWVLRGAVAAAVGAAAVAGWAVWPKAEVAPGDDPPASTIEAPGSAAKRRASAKLASPAVQESPIRPNSLVHQTKKDAPPVPSAVDGGG